MPALADLFELFVQLKPAFFQLVELGVDLGLAAQAFHHARFIGLLIRGAVGQEGFEFCLLFLQWRHALFDRVDVLLQRLAQRIQALTFGGFFALLVSAIGGRCAICIG